MKPFNLREHKETMTSTNTVITNPLVGEKQPIMSNKAKLYTEEQVRKAIRDTRYFTSVDSENDIINNMTPIELPSDEEIEKEANERVVVENVFVRGISAYYLLEGAKWVIDKIKNQQ